MRQEPTHLTIALLMASTLCACGSEYDPQEQPPTKGSRGYAANAEQTYPFRLQLFDRRVGCPAFGTGCYENGIEVVGEDIVGRAESHSSTVNAPGVKLVLSLPRPAGPLGRLTLDLPLLEPAQNVAGVRIEYAEDGETFAGASVIGNVEIPKDATCACQDIRFELVLTHPGADGVAGTADDLTRRFNAGIVGRTWEHYCRAAVALPAGDSLDAPPMTVSTVS